MVFQYDAKGGYEKRSSNDQSLSKYRRKKTNCRGIYPLADVNDNFKWSKSKDSHHHGIVRTRSGCSVIALATGFLISPRIVLTAAHAVYETYAAKKIEFLLHEKKKPIEILKVFHPADFPHNSSNDYALLVLKESIRDRQINFTLNYFEQEQLINKDIRIYGCPEFGLRDEYPVDSGQIFQIERDLILYKNIDTFPGMSGSGLFYVEEQTDKCYLVGIHVGSSANYKYATHLSVQRLQQIAEWVNDAKKLFEIPSHDLPTDFDVNNFRQKSQMETVFGVDDILGVESSVATLYKDGTEIRLESVSMSKSEHFPDLEYIDQDELGESSKRNEINQDGQKNESQDGSQDESRDETIPFVLLSGFRPKAIVSTIDTHEVADSYEVEPLGEPQNGVGQERWPDGSEYYGEFASGTRDGIGIWISKNRKVLYHGKWRDGYFYYGEFEWLTKVRFGAIFKPEEKNSLLANRGRIIDGNTGTKYMIDLKDSSNDRFHNPDIINLAERIQTFFSESFRKTSVGEVLKNVNLGRLHSEVFFESFPENSVGEILAIINPARLHSEKNILINDLSTSSEMTNLNDKQGSYMEIEYPNGDKYKGQVKNGKEHGSCGFQVCNGDEYLGNWFEGEKRGIGELRYTNGALYKGEWKNNQRHGIGEYIERDGYKYSGEWVNDQRNGIGEEILANGDKFKGFWQRGLKHGYGMYYKANRYELKAKWINNRHEGYCIIRFLNGDLYKGHWDEGNQPSGGKFLWKKGNKYKRFFSAAEAESSDREGRSFIQNPSDRGDWEIDLSASNLELQIKPDGEVYLGSLKNGKRHGRGRSVQDDEYVGDWLNDKPNGKGQYIWAGGKKYIGYFLNGQRHGKGTLEILLKSKYEKEIDRLEIFTNEGIYIPVSASNEVDFCTANLPFTFADSEEKSLSYFYEGEWKFDKREGEGEEIWPDGSYYKGFYSNNTRNGFGEYFSSDGENYIGNWKGGQKDGVGEIKWPDGCKYKGEFVNGEIEGEGEYFHRDGFRNKGKWKAGKLQDAVDIHSNLKIRTQESTIEENKNHRAQSKEKTKAIQDTEWLFDFLSSSEDQSQLQSQQKNGISPQFWENLDLIQGSSNTYMIPHKSKRISMIFEEEELFRNPLNEDYKDSFDEEENEMVRNCCFVRVEYTDGDRYVGFWKNGTKHGLGKCYFQDKGEYTGFWIAGRREKFGIMNLADGDKYCGEWKDDIIKGIGRFVWEDGSMYEGELDEGDPHGYGTIVYPDGDRYFGEWVRGGKIGIGKYVWSDGSEHTGWYFKGDPHGIGESRYANGEIYRGEWANGYKEGKGMYTWIEGRTYKGDWVNDAQEGYGLMRYPDGRVVNGKWKAGKPLKKVTERGSLQVGFGKFESLQIY